MQCDPVSGCKGTSTWIQQPYDGSNYQFPSNLNCQEIINGIFTVPPEANWPFEKATDCIYTYYSTRPSLDNPLYDLACCAYYRAYTSSVWPNQNNEQSVWLVSCSTPTSESVYETSSYGIVTALVQACADPNRPNYLQNCQTSSSDPPSFTMSDANAYNVMTTPCFNVTDVQQEVLYSATRLYCPQLQGTNGCSYTTPGSQFGSTVSLACCLQVSKQLTCTDPSFQALNCALESSCYESQFCGEALYTHCSAYTPGQDPLWFTDPICVNWLIEATDITGDTTTGAIGYVGGPLTMPQGSYPSTFDYAFKAVSDYCYNSNFQQQAFCAGIQLLGDTMPIAFPRVYPMFNTPAIYSGSSLSVQIPISNLSQNSYTNLSLTDTSPAYNGGVSLFTTINSQIFNLAPQGQAGDTFTLYLEVDPNFAAVGGQLYEYTTSVPITLRAINSYNYPPISGTYDKNAPSFGCNPSVTLPTQLQQSDFTAPPACREGDPNVPTLPPNMPGWTCIPYVDPEISLEQQGYYGCYQEGGFYYFDQQACDGMKASYTASYTECCIPGNDSYVSDGPYPPANTGACDYFNNAYPFCSYEEGQNQGLNNTLTGTTGNTQCIFDPLSSCCYWYGRGNALSPGTPNCDFSGQCGGVQFTMTGLGPAVAETQNRFSGICEISSFSGYSITTVRPCVSSRVEPFPMFILQQGDTRQFQYPILGGFTVGFMQNYQNAGLIGYQLFAQPLNYSISG